jgi:hypothetical protein
MLRALYLLLLAGSVLVLSGCSLFGVGRVGFGVTGSTDGTVGLSASAELGGGWIDTPHEITTSPRRGEALALYGGGGVSTRGAEIEAGGRVDYVSIGERTVRFGMRNGVVARQGELAVMALDAVFAMSLAQAWLPLRVSDVGFELRAGPAFELENQDIRFHAVRFYAGVVAERWSIQRHRYDPIEALFGDPKGTN